MFMRFVSAIVMLGALAGWLAGNAPALAAPEATHAETAAHGETAGHGEGGVNPLDFKTDLALWTGIVFLVVLAILWKFAWKPIADGLSKRENHILDEIAAAERSNAEARRLLDEYQRKLDAAGDEVRQMIEAARREAEQAGAQIVQQARAAAEAERDRALAEIDMATTGALKELADRSASLAVELAGKIVGSQLDRAAHNRLIEQALADFGKATAGRNGGAG
jgi:F-type H+-transporting ATPase subunit b